MPKLIYSDEKVQKKSFALPKQTSSKTIQPQDTLSTMIVIVMDLINKSTLDEFIESCIKNDLLKLPAFLVDEVLSSPRDVVLSPQGIDVTLPGVV